ncbi:hypothetical protein H6S82_19945 [Planktothrix sp. FACHB-1355]|uniref:Uncharacterized protein n=1 Tax=Aerosakkonema funiforme FACHB-1375 TaxID=2949571 RepID=A0A926VHF8_9CYAN|nr:MULTISPECIES: hypothetical protein [Oscillatoriales]MBD2182699.1 hypothetical protein [Aerosakkonema funiforme FACHB-1375]MBD3561106.1 hypothetical protein [Planktothrix sp. FACHB-1355]
MPVIVKSRRTSIDNLRKHYGEATIIDVTSRGSEPWIRFSPFYPHGNIPVPFSPGYFSMTVEGIWQGLKVFESADVDPSKLMITNMKGIKRTQRTHGKVLGHRAGLTGERLLSYAEARRAIYLPSYKWVLENCLQNFLSQIQQLSADKTLLLLDYETNCDLDNLSKPLSHASLIKRYLENDWPS